jgi:hypothetical protein
MQFLFAYEQVPEHCAILVLMVSTTECNMFLMSVPGGGQLSAHTLIALLTSFGFTLILSIQHNT